MSFPNILLINIKRFYYDSYIDKAGKYDDLIAYPEILEIGSEYTIEQQES
jgi:hypothetical protein